MTTTVPFLGRRKFPWERLTLFSEGSLSNLRPGEEVRLSKSSLPQGRKTLRKDKEVWEKNAKITTPTGLETPEKWPSRV